MVKNPPVNAGDTRVSGSIPESGRSPGEGNGNPFQYSCLEKFHGLRSSAGYSPWDRQELDMTEHHPPHTHTKSRLSYVLSRTLKPQVNSKDCRTINRIPPNNHHKITVS